VFPNVPAVRRRGIVLVIAATLAGCGGASHGAIGKGMLGTLVLAPADVPQMQRFDVGPQVRLDNLAGPRKDPTRFGREGGWKARYRRSGTIETRGPLVVESRADLFASDGGARRDLSAYDEEFREMINAAPTLRRRLAAPRGLGADALAMTMRQPGSGAASVRYFRIAWRDHNATGSVLVEGFDGKVTLAQALSLARAQEARMRAAA
jgi:hypothetical protein